MSSGARTPAFWVEAVVVLLILGLIVFAGATAVTTRDRTLANELANLEQLSLTLAEHSRRMVFGADLHVSAIEERMAASGVRSPEAFRKLAATREMHEVLQERVILTTDVDALSLIGANGVFLNSSRTWPPPALDMSDRDYFIALRDDPGAAFVISAPLKSRVTGQESIFLARRVSGPDGAFLGLITASMSRSRFEKLFAEVLHHESASVALYRRDGVLLGRQPLPGDDADQSPEVREFFRETVSRAEHGTLRSRTLATPRLMALHTVRGYPLLVNVTNSEAAVLAEWRRLAQPIALFTVAAIALLVLLALAFVRQQKMQARVVEALEQRAYANKRLVAANRELEAFSYSISHDLRAPLRAIDGFSRIVLKGNRDRLDETAVGHLNRIMAGAEHMGRLIDDLLNLSRVSRQDMRRQTIDITELARQAANAAAEAHPGRKVQVTVMPGMRDNADPGMARIVFDNLVGNAWKFTAPVAEAKVDIGAEAREGGNVYFVRDNGTGFDMKYAEKLFVPFQRLHDRGEFEGTGIGLSIVARVIARHGGRVWAEAEPDKGATFYFTLGPDSETTRKRRALSR